MNESPEYISKIMRILGDSGFLSFVGVVVILFLVWLLLRKLKLWYWKVDLQIDTLKNIDEKLKYLDDLKEYNKILTNDVEVPQEKTTQEIVSKEQEAILDYIQPETVYIKNKTGKIYTEEELEELIKD